MDKITDTSKHAIETLFDAFVAAMHDGRHPYAWQRRLLCTIIDAGRWPDRLEAPTGAGKTMAMDIHVFVNALAGLVATEGHGADIGDVDVRKMLVVLDPSTRKKLIRLPRRLVMTVNRRSLVDDQYEEACNLADGVCYDATIDADTPSILHAIRQGLVARETNMTDTGEDDQIADRRTLRVTRLRGGEATDAQTREWRYHPTECQIMCATPDMFGSRLLFRGYGTFAAARPIEAAMLAYDTVLVADEAHLNRQLVLTARSVGRLDGDNPVSRYIPTLQVVATTATQDDEDADGTLCVGVEESDFDTDIMLKRRMITPKPIDIVECDDERQLIERAVERCMAAIETVDGTTGNGEMGAPEETVPGVVGCIVNSVKTATAILTKLRNEYGNRCGINVKQHGACRPSKNGDADDGQEKVNRAIRGLVGPMRQYDKHELTRGRVFDALRGDADAIAETGLRCVVATQTLEVGVDADFSTLITELAPGSALAQRAGRVNRRGARACGSVTVLCRPSTDKASGIYQADDLTAARSWLEARRDAPDGLGLAAWACAQHPPQAVTPTRMLWQRPEIWDIEYLAHTDENLASDIALANQGAMDLDLWLHDDLQSQVDPNIGLIVRHLPANDQDVTALLNDAPPLADESFPLTHEVLKDITKKKTDDFRIFIAHPGHRSEGWTVTRWSGEPALAQAARPGDILVADVTAPLFDPDMHIVNTTTGKREQDVYNACQNETMIIDALADDADMVPLRRGLLAIRDRLIRLDTASDTADNMESSDSSASTDTTNRRRSRTSDALDLASLLDDSAERAAVKAALDAANEQLSQQLWTSEPTETGQGVYTVYPAAGTIDDLAGETIWLVARSAANVLDDGTMMQELSPVDRWKSGQRRGPVYLNRGTDCHQWNVRNRVKRFLAMLPLAAELADDVMLAAAHHDDGKKDPRFQELLHYRLRRPERYTDADYLAKSRFRSAEFEARTRRELNLQGWRHEQRSAAECWAAGDSLGAHDRELVTRLAGTSHGHGRGSFRDNASTLIPDMLLRRDDEQPVADIKRIRAAAESLYDEGEWGQIIERTDARYGHWGMAYLEALLRSADITVSKEGH